MALDTSFFDTHSMTEIRGGMAVESISNLISWNFPYLLTRCFKLFFAIYFMCTISLPMAALAILSLLLIKYALLGPLGEREKKVGRIQRKHLIKNDQIQDEALDMVSQRAVVVTA
jgi:hypothetical protein